MALQLSTLDLLFLDAWVKDKGDQIDATIADLKRKREALGQRDLSDAEEVLMSVRASAARISTKIAQDLDVPFREPVLS